jgi:PASTA domain
MRWSSSRTAIVGVLVAGLVVLVVMGRILAATSSIERPATSSAASSTAPASAGIRVPDVVGQPLATATALMRTAGLRGVASDHDPSAPGAIVVAQEPAAGLMVPEGSVVGFRTRDDLQPNGTLRSLRLERGTTTATYPLVAPAPARHRLVVAVRTSGPADLQLWVETGSGTRLPVLDGDRSRQATTCQPAGMRPGSAQCMTRFEGLEAEHAGVWAVNLLKRSAPPVTVEVMVTFVAR